MPVVDRFRLRRLAPRGTAGHAMIELALIGPWLFLLFAVILNFGLFMYTGISVANAARAAAIELGRSGDTALSKSCDIVKAELSYLPGITTGMTCTSAPLTVGNHSIGNPTPDGNGQSAIVTVTYVHPPMFALPGMSPNFTIVRTAEVRVFQ